MQQRNENELEAELELAMLQIHQLQEELEQYFLAYSRLKESSGVVALASDNTNQPALSLLRKARLQDTKYTQSPEYHYSKEQQQKIIALENTVSKITKENQQIELFESQLKSKTAELATLHAKLSETNKQFEEHKSKQAEQITSIEKNHKQGLIKQEQEFLAENELLTLQIHQLQEELESTYNENQHNKNRVVLAEKEIAELSSAKNELTATMANVKESLKLKDAQIVELESTNVDLLSTIEQVQTEAKIDIELLTENNRALSNELSHIALLVEQKDLDIAELFDELSSSENLLSEKGEVVTTLQSEIETLLLNQSTMQSNVDKIQAERDLLAKSNQFLTDQLKAESTLGEQSEAEIAELTDELSQLNNQLTEVKEVNVSFKALNETLTLNQSELQASIGALKAERDSLNDNNQSLNEQLKAESTLGEQSEAEIAELTDELSQLNNQLTEVKEVNSTFKALNETLELTRSELQASIEKVQAERDSILESHHSLNEKLKEREVLAEQGKLEIAKLVDALSQASEVATKNEQVQIQLTSELAQKQSEISTIQCESEQLKSSYEQAKSRVSQHESTLNSLNNNINELTAQRDEFNNNLHKSEILKINLEKQIVELKGREGNLAIKSKEKDNAIEKLTKENKELTTRLTLLDTEILKVESQLELVKDVVLREKAF